MTRNKDKKMEQYEFSDREFLFTEAILFVGLIIGLIMRDEKWTSIAGGAIAFILFSMVYRRIFHPLKPIKTMEPNDKHIQDPTPNAANVAQGPGPGQPKKVKKSIGERRVRTIINPNQTDTISQILQKGAELINLISSLQPKAAAEWDGEDTNEFFRLRSLAMTDAESATSWALKAATA